MKIIQTKNLKWVDIKSPDETDLKWVEENFKLHPLVLKELLPSLDHPKIENFGDYLFIVVFYPFYDRASSQTIPFELDIIISKDYILTIHEKDIVPLKSIFDDCNLYDDLREKYTDEGTGELLYRIIRQILFASLPKLGHIKEKIDTIDDAIFKKDYTDVVNKISLVQRDIIGFQRIVEPQGLVLNELSKESVPFFGKQFSPYFKNLVNRHQQVSGILETHQKVLSALDTTNQSLLTTRTNEIMKTLTLFSVIVFPLTLIAAIFGMNTKYLPIVGVKHDFWVVSGVMIIGAFVMLFYFKRKKWL